MARSRRTDDTTADRLLSGRLAPDDAPPGLARVATLFASAAVPADPADPDEALLTAMSVAALSAEAPNRRNTMLSKSRTAKIGAVAFGGLVLLGGTAAAGELPDPLQDAAADVADVVGVDLPDSSNGLAETVHTIKETAEPGTRGQKISDAAHARNEARKNGTVSAADEDGDSTTHGKSAEAKKRAEANKQAHEDEADEATTPSLPESANENADDRADNADDEDNAADPTEKADEEATERGHLEDAPGLND